MSDVSLDEGEEGVGGDRLGEGGPVDSPEEGGGTPISLLGVSSLALPSPSSSPSSSPSPPSESLSEDSRSANGDRSGGKFKLVHGTVAESWNPSSGVSSLGDSERTVGPIFKVFGEVGGKLGKGDHGPLDGRVESKFVVSGENEELTRRDHG